MEYKILRLLSYFIASFFGLIVSAAVVGLLFFYVYPENGLIGFAIIGSIAAILISLLFGFIGFQMTNQNAWVKAIQGEAMLLIGFASGGVGQVFNCVTRPNPSGGIDIVTKINKEQVILAYDKKMAFRLMSPIKAFFHLVHPKKHYDGEKIIGEEDANTVITIPNQDFDKHVFRFGYITVLFFNFETGTLINKFQVNDLEKFFIMKYLSLHLDRKADTYISELRLARKNFINSLLNRLSDFIHSPMFGILAVAFIIIIIIVFLVIAFPQLGQWIGSFFGGAKPVDVNAGLPPAMTKI